MSLNYLDIFRYLKGFGQASLSGARRVYMPPRLKTKTSALKSRVLKLTFLNKNDGESGPD